MRAGVVAAVGNRNGLPTFAAVSEHRHFLLYKPFGYLSQFRSEDAREARKKRFLGELHDFPAGTMAVGRLDEHSEGLLLLTTNGLVSERIRRKDVEKEYYAQLDGLVTEEALARLRTGVEISVEHQPYQTLPGAAHRLPEAPDLPPRPRKIRDDRHGPTSWVSITVTEGKNRQVRKMTAAVGFPTLRLVRVGIGGVALAGLAPGEVREVPDVVALVLG
ncbi:pseudouridine synthase [Hymenobacter lapidiphilus]|uniref:Pseudouridine synthase n=1 Tax=Hymenobacter lapidiphilus TaxID=2608003 RepID=A0A7Y7PSM0_9BACT|nr:pseudouridine synthase [Hymenobacter lapidiphilus]NVO32942.1 pseudouridine synthase [Hymenobacter lapidiphilus]